LNFTTLGKGFSTQQNYQHEKLNEITLDEATSLLPNLPPLLFPLPLPNDDDVSFNNSSKIPDNSSEQVIPTNEPTSLLYPYPTNSEVNTHSPQYYFTSIPTFDEKSSHQSKTPVNQLNYESSTQPSAASNPSLVPSLIPSPIQYSKPSNILIPLPTVTVSQIIYINPTNYHYNLKPSMGTLQPSMVTFKPTIINSIQPTSRPSDTQPIISTFNPTLMPTMPSIPTLIPTATDIPTNKPSVQPSNIPTAPPSLAPLVQPTIELSYPTAMPTLNPSNKPSVQPSSKPTTAPAVDTAPPSLAPLVQPTIELSYPTAMPTLQPEVVLTSEPSFYPSSAPISLPLSTISPTSPLFLTAPSLNPTAQPGKNYISTAYPSGTPTQMTSYKSNPLSSFSPTKNMPTLSPSAADYLPTVQYPSGSTNDGPSSTGNEDSKPIVISFDVTQVRQ
jgi:hypothetical protein